MTSEDIRAAQVERNRARFGQDDYPGGGVSGLGWDGLDGELAVGGSSPPGVNPDLRKLVGP